MRNYQLEGEVLKVVDPTGIMVWYFGSHCSNFIAYGEHIVTIREDSSIYETVLIGSDGTLYKTAFWRIREGTQPI